MPNATGQPPAGDATPWSRLRALVLGGTGMIGCHTVQRLLARGVRVRVLVRPSSEAKNLEGLAVERVPGDLADAASIRDALRDCDLLFHCAAPYPRSHFRRERQVAAAVAGIEICLGVAREFVPPDLLRLPPGHLFIRDLEQAESAAETVRYQPERAEELRRQVHSPELLEAALAGRLNASLHRPLAEVAELPGLKRIVYVSSITTIGRPHGRPRPTSGPIGSETNGPSSWANESDRHDRIRASSPYFSMKEGMESAVTRAAVEGMPIVIGNPTFCVDTHDVVPTSGLLLIAIARKSMPFYLPGSLNVVATRDVAEALVHAAAWGRTGHRYILGGDNMTAREFLNLAAKVAGTPPPGVPIPLPVAEAVAWTTEVANLVLRRPWPLLPLSGVQMMRHSQPVDCRLAGRDLAMPRTVLATAIADAFDWFRRYGYV